MNQLGIFRGQWPSFSELASSRAGQILLGAGAGLLLGAVIAAKLALLALLLGAVIAAAAVAVALVHPGRAFFGLVLVTALIPTYAAPGVGPILFIPAAALSWVLAGVLAWRNAMTRGRILQPTPIDWLALAFFGLMFVSLSFSAQVEFNDYLNILFAWTGPFLAARLLLAETKRPAFVVAAAFATATVLVAPIAVLEAIGQENPFLNFQFNGVEAATWAAPASRLGQIRAEASFGHPIALSMFASASALLSLGMAVHASLSKERWTWLALAAVGVGVQALTFSRTGWLMLVVGIVLLALTTALRAARRRLAGIIVVSTVAVFALMLSGAAPSALQIIPSNKSSSEEGQAFAESGAYREKLLERALEPGVLGLWGNPYNKVTRAVSSTNNATDNAYIILADGWGLIPTFALFALAAALLVAIALARRRGAGELVALPIAAFTTFFALFFVAFITQQQVMIWMLIGAASAAGTHLLSDER